MSADDAYWVYSFASHEGGGDLAKIGAAIPHADGNGFNVILDALPLTPKLVVRKPAARQGQNDRPQSLSAQVESFERALIEQCLFESGGVISSVMERLNIPRRTLNEKMARYGIDRRRLSELGKPKPGSEGDSHIAKHVQQATENAEARHRAVRPSPRKMPAPDDERGERPPAETRTSK